MNPALTMDVIPWRRGGVDPPPAVVSIARSSGSTLLDFSRVLVVPSGRSVSVSAEATSPVRMIAGAAWPAARISRRTRSPLGPGMFRSTSCEHTVGGDGVVGVAGHGEHLELWPYDQESLRQRAAAHRRHAVQDGTVSQ